MTRPTDNFEQIKALLRLEREAISIADFDKLDGLVQKKERLIGSLGALSAHEISELKVLAQSNHRLLGAALKGVQAAQRRLMQIVESSKGFTSYDTAGRSRQISTRNSSIEKKA